jgi:hypothetical protein
MSDWIFNESYRAQYDLPPTQQREVVKRLAKKNIVDVTAASDEIMAVLRAVHSAYGNKKERARAASAKSRASKKDVDEVYCGDIEDAVVTCDAGTAVCDVAVDCVAEAVPEPAQAAPEAVAAPTPAVAKSKSVKRADNVAVEPTCVAPACVAPTPKRLVEATPRRGLCAMVASASI